MKKEICVASPQAVRLLEDFPFDRIETCAALESGGLTPSESFVHWIHDSFHNIEQHILIRLRAGGFMYTSDEIIIMRDQISRFYQQGFRGFVVGALQANGRIHEEALSVWKRAAPDASFTFHRAFDDCSDWRAGMQLLIKMGFQRILTSGGKAQIDITDPIWKAYLETANGEIEIMAGGGLKPEHLPVFNQMGMDAVHFSGTKELTLDPESLFHTKALIPDQDKLKSYFQ